MAKYIIANNNITFFHNGRPVSVQKGSTQYAKVLKAFDLPADKQDQAIADILDAPIIEMKKAKAAGFEFSNEGIKVGGELVPAVLANKVNRLREEGLPFNLFLNFWANLKQNPSFTVINDTGFLDFLEYKELPITEDGCFLAYKGLDEKYWSIRGNTATKVLKGKTNAGGHIYNGIGESILVERSSVDDNRNNTCSFGVHVGSLDYAKGWARGKVVVVKINPKHVVSVPTDCSCQKLRCCGYDVISEFVQEITVAATTSKGEAIVDESQADLSAFEKRIQAYLDKKYSQGENYVTISQIRNSFSPDYPDKKRVLAALNSLGYVWRTEIGGKEYVEL
jgi:hypothetical protein